MRSARLTVAFQRLCIVAQRRKVGGDVAWLYGGHLEPRTGSLQSQPLRYRLDEELAARVDSKTRKHLPTSVRNHHNLVSGCLCTFRPARDVLEELFEWSLMRFL